MNARWLIMRPVQFEGEVVLIMRGGVGIGRPPAEAFERKWARLHGE